MQAEGNTKNKPVIKTIIKKVNLRIGWDIVADPKDTDNVNVNNKFKCGFCHKFLVCPPPQELQLNNETNGVVIEGKLSKGKCGCIFHEKCVSGYLQAGNVSCPKCNIPWSQSKSLKSGEVHGKIEGLTVKKKTIC